MNKTLLELNDVNFSYQSEGTTFTALSGIHLEILQGDFTAIIGPSGSGKSTLLNLLGLLARPTSGQIKLYDSILTELPDEQLAILRNKDIGFVFQNFALISRLTVLENILLPSAFETTQNPHADLDAAYRNKALALLERFSLRDLAQRLPSELSGGQKQRVAICRALLMNPRLLLADEPTGALDSASSQEVMRILTELHAEGCTVVVITHDPDIADKAQRILTIRDGRLVGDERKLSVGDCPSEEKVGREFGETFGKEEKTEPSRFSKKTSSPFMNLVLIFLQSITLAKRSLATHRARSLLTGLGLFIGILSLIVIDGLGEIVENSFNKLFFTPNIRKAYIFYDRDRGGFHGSRNRLWRGLHAETEFPRLAQMFAKKGIIRPFLQSSTCQVKSESGSLRTRLAGVSDPEEFLEMETPLIVGRWPSGAEFAAGTAVVVLGSDTVDQIFSVRDARRRLPEFPVGERVTVSDCNTLVTLTVIGVLGKRDTSFGNREANDTLFVPMRTLLNRKGPTFFSWFSILPHPGVDSRHLADEVTSFLTLQSGGKLTFGSAIPADILARVRGFLWIVQAIVGFIGALCLFVGGIGIMNMMLVTVAERTREIGLLKSLGAQNSHVRAYILTEAVLLCFWAGCASLFVGFVVNNSFSFGVSLFVPSLKEFRLIVAPTGLTLGLIVSVGCGLGFGALPANRAAVLDPAECLRSE